MSRIGTPEAIEMKPTNDVYTVMVGIALLVEVLAMVVMVMRFKDVFGQGMFSSTPEPTIKARR